MKTAPPGSAKTGPEFKVVRKNALDDYAWATPAMARGSLFIRTYTGLYRLQATRSAAGR